MQRVTRDNPIDRAEFHRRLLSWLGADVADVRIDGRPPGTSGGGNDFIYVCDGGEAYYLNSDSTREGVTAYLTQVLESGGALAWIPVLNRSRTNPRMNAIAVGQPPAPIRGFYFYIVLDE